MIGANKKKKVSEFATPYTVGMPSQKAELQLSYRHS